MPVSSYSCYTLFRAIRPLRSGHRLDDVDCTKILQPLERVKCINKRTAGDYSGQEDDFKILEPGDLSEGRNYDQVANYEDYILYDDFLHDKTGVNKTFTWHPIIINGWDFVWYLNIGKLINDSNAHVHKSHIGLLIEQDIYLGSKMRQILAAHSGHDNATGKFTIKLMKIKR